MIGASMKPADIRKCDICERGLVRDGRITFFRVNFERMGVDIDAVKGVVGLTHIVGNEQLAAVLAPNDNIARPICPADELIVCDMCAMAHRDPIFYLAESAAEKAYARRGKA